MNITEILNKFAKLNIVVIGDIMLDHYILGDATRISPEAPVPVVSVAKDHYVPGGAANVGNNFAGLGVPTTLIGSYTDDPESQLLNEVLQQRAIRLSPIGKKEGATTIVKNTGRRAAAATLPYRPRSEARRLFFGRKAAVTRVC
jgi:bifunctional ADP-heptose synthase (sugar kinase/adenylyltransferase)